MYKTAQQNLQRKTGLLLLFLAGELREKPPPQLARLSVENIRLDPGPRSLFIQLSIYSVEEM